MLTGKLLRIKDRLRKRNVVRIKSELTDFSPEEIDLFKFVEPFTMTSPERVKALSDSIKYLVKNDIEGSFVECGVWKGGSIMVMLKVLNSLSNYEREIYLYDTFEGMTKPSEFDIDRFGKKAQDRLITESKENSWVWAKASHDLVKINISSIPYPSNKIHFIKGKVEDSLKENKPSKIALLRLDTDWYESTRIELLELFDLVSKDGIIIIDDYGHWGGCKKAVDEFFENRKEKVFLHRIDYTGRLIVKI